MDRFVAWSDTGGLTMGHYRTANVPLWRAAHRGHRPSIRSIPSRRSMTP
jgi:hypothetical protein